MPLPDWVQDKRTQTDLISTASWGILHFDQRQHQRQTRQRGVHVL